MQIELKDRAVVLHVVFFRDWDQQTKLIGGKQTLYTQNVLNSLFFII